MQETERRRAAGTQVGCDHCGLPVPARAADPRFCCPGCATVWELLHANGLERFYELGGGRGFPVPSRAAGAAPLSRPWLDALVRPIAGARAGSDPGQGLAQVDLDVQGIHCAACVWVLQTTWGQTDGTLDIRPVGVVWRARDHVLIGEGLDDGEAIVTSPLSGPVAGLRLRREDSADG